MNRLVPLLGAGATFAGAVLVGFAAGVWADARTGSVYYTLVGLLIGLSVGAYGAARLIARSL